MVIQIIKIILMCIWFLSTVSESGQGAFCYVKKVTSGTSEDGGWLLVEPRRLQGWNLQPPTHRPPGMAEGLETEFNCQRPMS